MIEIEREPFHCFFVDVGFRGSVTVNTEVYAWKTHVLTLLSTKPLDAQMPIGFKSRGAFVCFMKK